MKRWRKKNKKKEQDKRHTVFCIIIDIKMSRASCTLIFSNFELYHVQFTYTSLLVLF